MSHFISICATLTAVFSSKPLNSWEQVSIDWSDLSDIIPDWTDNPRCSTIYDDVAHAALSYHEDVSAPVKVTIKSSDKHVLHPAARATHLVPILTETAGALEGHVMYPCRHQPCKSKRHTEGLCRRHFRDVLGFDTYDEAFKFAKKNPCSPDVLHLRDKYNPRRSPSLN